MSNLRLGEMERDALLDHSSMMFHRANEEINAPKTIDEAYDQFIDSIRNDRNFKDMTDEQIKNTFTFEYYLDFRASIATLGSVPMKCRLREV